jgi:uncharacterized low-complexity protein
MSKYRILSTLVGIQHIDQTTASTPDTTFRMPRNGSILPAWDPYWGGGEFLYCRFSAAVRAKALVQFAPVFDSALNRWIFEAAEAANTANSGRSVGVAVQPVTGAGLYGWVQIEGVTPVNSSAALAADVTFGITATGQVGANSAGKQIQGARTIGVSTAISVKAAQGSLGNVGQTGSNLIQVTNTDGWFLGGYVSGTGIAAGAVVTAIDINEQLVTLSLANTATVTGNVTFTYNNGTVFFNVITLNRPNVQGAIT